MKLNLLLLGSYDVLIGMGWLEKHIVDLNYFEKAFTWLDDKGETVTVKGIPRKVFVRQNSALQMKKYVHKGCKFFVVHVMNDEHMNKGDKLKLDDIPILKEFSDVFPEEIPGFLRKENWILILNYYLEMYPIQRLLTRWIS